MARKNSTKSSNGSGQPAVAVASGNLASGDVANKASGTPANTAAAGIAQANAATAANPAGPASAGAQNSKAKSDQETDAEEKFHIRVNAPSGPRRRAGLSFSPIPVDLKWSELGVDDEAREAAEKLLIDDPELAVAFYDYEGTAD